MDEIRGVARILGVINTVAFERAFRTGRPETTADTRLIGYNTDVAGIVNALRHAGPRHGPTAVVLGGGGTAAAAVAALKELGAPAADVFVRDVSRAAEARAASAAARAPVQVLPIAGAAAAIAAADVVISTLPPRAADPLAAGAAGTAAECRRERPGPAPQPGVLLDVAYDPWPSRIAAVWQDARRRQWFPGLEMLIYQAVEQVRHFTGLGGRRFRPKS